MEYIYAALMLNESGGEINEDNLTSVLEAADVDVEESRVRALVAALEDVDIEEAIEGSAAVPAGGAGGGGAVDAAGVEEESEEDPQEDPEEEAPDEDEDEGDDDEDASGEGLGELFG